MHGRTVRLIELALDPRGKWYGSPWLVGTLPQVPEVVPVSDEDETPAEPDAGSDHADVGRGEGWDEWEPA